MLAGILDLNLDNFDIVVVIATILFIFAAVLARPAREPRPPASAYAATIGFLAAAVFAFGFLWLTP